MFGEKLARGLPKPPPPPPPCVASGFGAFTCGETPNWVAKTPKWDARMRRATGGGGNSTTKQYFKMLISTWRCVFLILSLLQCQSLPISFLRAEMRENRAYINTLHSTGNISAEDSVHKNKVGHNNTHGMVSSLLFFLLNILLHKVYISNILCGLRLWVQDLYSKRSLSLAMFKQHLMNISL